MKQFILIILAFSFTVALNAQSESNTKNMIHTIDSIAKAKNITSGQVLNYRTDGTIDVSGINTFKFVGPFIVLKDIYYNTDKLLSFFIVERKNNSYISFSFQNF